MNTHFDPVNRSGARRLVPVGIAILSLLVIFLVAETGAQDAPPDVNNSDPQTEPVPAVPEAPSFGEAPEGFSWSVNGELVAVGEAVAASAPAERSAVASTGSGTKYYLTDANYLSTGALTACAPGYHMASLWEIFDPSNLTYVYDHPDAHTKGDSGQGPPSEWFGRVHTGTTASTVQSAGTANCAGWTSVDGNDYGTFVRLTRAWETPPGEIGGLWDASAFGCNLVGPVWCIQE